MFHYRYSCVFLTILQRFFLFFATTLLPNHFKSSHSKMFFKIGVLNHFAIFTEKYMCWSLSLIKLHERETLTQVLSCECCEIFKNTFLIEYLQGLLLSFGFVETRLILINLILAQNCNSYYFTSKRWSKLRTCIVCSKVCVCNWYYFM